MATACRSLVHPFECSRTGADNRAHECPGIALYMLLIQLILAAAHSGTIQSSCSGLETSLRDVSVLNFYYGSPLSLCSHRLWPLAASCIAGRPWARRIRLAIHCRSAEARPQRAAVLPLLRRERKMLPCGPHWALHNGGRGKHVTCMLCPIHRCAVEFAVFSHGVQSSMPRLRRFQS